MDHVTFPCAPRSGEADALGTDLTRKASNQATDLRTDATRKDDRGCSCAATDRQTPPASSSRDGETRAGLARARGGAQGSEGTLDRLARGVRRPRLLRAKESGPLG